MIPYYDLQYSLEFSKISIISICIPVFARGVWSARHQHPVIKLPLTLSHIELSVIGEQVKVELAQNALQREWGNFPFANRNGIC